MALSVYDGGLFIVSHDEHLITTACNELWVMDAFADVNERFYRFDGDFEAYKRMLRKKSAAAAAVAKGALADAKAEAKAAKSSGAGSKKGGSKKKK